MKRLYLVLSKKTAAVEITNVIPARSGDSAELKKEARILAKKGTLPPGKYWVRRLDNPLGGGGTWLVTTIKGNPPKTFGAPESHFLEKADGELIEEQEED